MTRKRWAFIASAVLAGALLAVPVLAQEASFKDPTGDDNGPGTYTYPTDGVYKTGSFDLTGFSLKARGKKADVEVSLNSTIEDPWKMGNGFSVQMVFIFIDTDGKDGSGYTGGLPGLNVSFAAGAAWDKCIILSPQPPGRVKSEIEAKASADMKKAIIVPTKTKGAGRTLSTTIDTAELGEGDPTTWGYQVLVQSNEGFPDKTDLLTRKVNEYEGQHRFGGGNDGDCDPHVMDCLAGNGAGDKSEIEAQHAMLAFECQADGTSKKMAELSMIRMKK
ncbi:MAG TPA: glucodextranase DOMON-like domain-containing protein [Acidobacteriota bacterium]|nr:glucodextranase DOMON-like domain-containing protein [Acidobacteriota bacterium]